MVDSNTKRTMLLLHRNKLYTYATCGRSYYAAAAPGPMHFTGDGGVKYIFHNFSCDNTNRSSMLTCYLLAAVTEPTERGKQTLLPFGVCSHFICPCRNMKNYFQLLPFVYSGVIVTMSQLAFFIGGTLLW